MFVFVGSDIPLSFPNEDGAPIFGNPVGDNEQAVRRLFSKPHVYDLTAFGGCGCCFDYHLSDLDSEAEGLRTGYHSSRQSVLSLREHLASAAEFGAVEVYSCWEGDYEADPVSRLEVGLDYFGGDEFHFNEKEFITVTPSAAAEAGGVNEIAGI